MKSLFVATMLASAPAMAQSANVPDAPEPSDSAEGVELSRALFRRGLDAYDAGDYAGAVDNWTVAYDVMDDDASLVDARRGLAFDLGQAHVKAYDDDKDRTRLHKARTLLRDFVASVDRPGHLMSDEEEQDRPRAIESLDRIDGLLGASAPPPVLPAGSGRNPGRDDVPRRKPGREGRGLIIGGAATLAGGVVFAIGAGVGATRIRKAEDEYVRALERLQRDPSDQGAFVDRERAEFDGKQASAATVATATLSAISAAAGVTMLTLGILRRKRASSNVAVTPTLAPQYAGAHLRLKF